MINHVHRSLSPFSLGFLILTFTIISAFVFPVFPAGGFVDAAQPYSAGPPSPVGATVYTGTYPVGTTEDQAVGNFSFTVGRKISVLKIYFPPATGSNNAQAFPTTPNQYVQAAIDFNMTAILCYKPRFLGLPATAYPDDLQKLKTSLIALHSAGLQNAIVVLWQEPQNAANQLNATQYQALMSYYYAAVHAVPGWPLYYDAAGHVSTEWASYYPGDDLCDGVAVDFYCSTWAATNGTLSLDPLVALADNANPHPKPFGIFEIGIALDARNVPDETIVTAYMKYIIQLMSDRRVAGKVNGPVAWYNGITPNWNTISPQPPLSGYNSSYVAYTLYPALWDALEGVGSNGSTLSPTPSSNSSSVKAAAASDCRFTQNASPALLLLSLLLIVLGLQTEHLWPL